MTIQIPFVQLKSQTLDKQIECFQSIPEISIANVNWEAFSYRPKVTVKMAYQNDSLFLLFSVNEMGSRALHTQHGDAVWEDSCCEFFIAFDDAGYYNIECNAIGTLLCAFGKNRDSRISLSADVQNHITVFPSAGNMPFDIKDEPFNYQLLMEIKSSFFKYHNFKTFENLKAKANLYKCGNLCQQKHFLSWMPIDTPTPDFHRPEYFGEIFSR